MGRKRFNHQNNFQPKSKKYCKRYKDVDWISRLPDEILISILSSLPLNEAARTSILSSRWTNLWKYTACLKFDAHSALDKIAEHEDEIKVLKAERRKYVKWVNAVLRLHQGLTLKEFKIYFDLDKSSQKSITGWLDYAFGRQVESFELVLLDRGIYEVIGPEAYVLPQRLLRRSPHDFKSLKTLRLNSIDVSAEAIEFFLRECPLLKHLSVHSARKISNLEVCGSSLVLKHLAICYCPVLESLKVSAPNLTCLRVTRTKGLILENVPMLVELDIPCGLRYKSANLLAPAILFCMFQLEILTLSLTLTEYDTKQDIFPELVPKLKKLVIDFCALDNGSLMGLTTFIRAAPCLEEFQLNLSGNYLSRRKWRVKKNDITAFEHQLLKVVKFTGYYGRASDVELIKYFLENAVVLEKIIIDPHHQSSFGEVVLRPSQSLDKERTARKYAMQQLQPLVPHHINLLIL